MFETSSSRIAFVIVILMLAWAAGGDRLVSHVSAAVAHAETVISTLGGNL